LILRPLHILLIIALIFFLVKTMWLFAGVLFLGIVYLGIIGSKLHPYQSASDLAKGPLKGMAAITESNILSTEMEKSLVGHACTRVGILVGVISIFFMWFILGWRWYFIFITGLFILFLTGALLKLFFKTV